MVEDKLKRVGQKPGVYLLKDRDGKVLYVGKAKALRNRLRSHFKPGRFEEPRHKRLMAQVVDFETVITDSEVEALILEANFIKEYKPRYNVNLKDDKSYPYIRVTNDPYPRIFVTRKLIRDGSRYFGPYTDVGNMRQLMAAIRRIFPIRTCGLRINAESIKKEKHKVCLNYHIGRCKGPCEGLISQEDYLWFVNQVVAFIQGKNDKLLKDLTERMRKMAEQKQFEEAALLRDEIKSISTFQSRQKVVDEFLADRDLITVAIEDQDACGVVFNVRDGKIVNRQHFYLKGADRAMENEIIPTFVKQYYIRAEHIPDEIFIDADPKTLVDVQGWLSQKKGKKVKVIAPQRGRKADLMRMCARNARLLLDELLLQKQAGDWIASSVRSLQKDLNLEKPPKRIEAFDISTIQGSDTVASMVVFENGKPKKSEYRKYKIRSVEGVDDFAAMAEVIERWISRLKKEEKTLPDLFLVDGGKGQLSTAVSILQKYGISGQPIIGLAKRLEEVFLPGISDPQNISKSSPSLHLLQRIRDEAHRFAITYHRQQRKKRVIHSELDDIPGIGPARRKALLKAFGSVEGIKKATIEEILRISGLNRNVAETLKEELMK